MSTLTLVLYCLDFFLCFVWFKVALKLELLIHQYLQEVLCMLFDTEYCPLSIYFVWKCLSQYLSTIQHTAVSVIHMYLSARIYLSSVQAASWLYIPASSLSYCICSCFNSVSSQSSDFSFLLVIFGVQWLLYSKLCNVVSKKLILKS